MRCAYLVKCFRICDMKGSVQEQLFSYYSELQQDRLNIQLNKKFANVKSSQKGALQCSFLWGTKVFEINYSKGSSTLLTGKIITQLFQKRAQVLFT